RLNSQELRNADFFGFFKSLAYDLSNEQLDRWRAWGVFDIDQIARMNEVELMSEFMMLLTHGAMSTGSKAMGQAYGKYEDAFPAGPEVGRRVRRVFDEIDERIEAAAMREIF